MNGYLKCLIASRYVHLCLGILLLYGIAWSVTKTTVEERILDSLQKYCHSEYWVRESLFEKERREAEFYRRRYRERLEALTAGLFDYRDKKQVQSFLLPKRFLYDAWEEGRGNSSYLLAKIVIPGRHVVEVPKKITVDYLILGEKMVAPFPEFKHGKNAGRLILAGDEKIYIRRDRLDSTLRWYFESLYQTEPKKPENHYIEWKGVKEPLTFFLYQDLKGICEDIFVKRLFRKKCEARDYFVEQGFQIFLPSLFAIAARMAEYKDLPLHPEERYLRAALSGLADCPTYTLFYFISESELYGFTPSAKKILKQLKSRFDFNYPETISLERIAQVSREGLQTMERMGH